MFYLLKLLKESQRYFKHSGMYDYQIDNIEIVSNHCVKITIREVSPTGEVGDQFIHEFSNGAGYLCIHNAITDEDVFDYAEEFGWDEETIKFIRYGNKAEK